METKKYRHFLVTRIRPRDEHDHHDEDYTAFLTRYFYDPDSRKTYYYLGDPVDYVPVGNGHLFAEITYERQDLHEVVSQNFTETRPYPLPKGKEYDPPLGLKLCAESNADEYHKVSAKLLQLREKAKDQPIRNRLSDLLTFYDRILYDTERWFRENCRDYLEYLEPREAPDQSLPGKLDADKVVHEESPAAATNRKKREVKQFAVKPGTAWDEVELTITQWDKLKISARGRSKSYHFSKIGFAGRKPNEPGTLWELLLFISVQHGSFNKNTRSNLDAKTELKSQVKNLRNKLKAIIPIDEDPIPFDRSHYDVGEYRHRFKISHELPN